MKETLQRTIKNSKDHQRELQKQLSDEESRSQELFKVLEESKYRYGTIKPEAKLLQDAAIQSISSSRLDQTQFNARETGPFCNIEEHRKMKEMDEDIEKLEESERNLKEELQKMQRENEDLMADLDEAKKKSAQPIIKKGDRPKTDLWQVIKLLADEKEENFLDQIEL